MAPCVHALTLCTKNIQLTLFPRLIQQCRLKASSSPQPEWSSHLFTVETCPLIGLIRLLDFNLPDPFVRKGNRLPIEMSSYSPIENTCMLGQAGHACVWEGRVELLLAEQFSNVYGQPKSFMIYLPIFQLICGGKNCSYLRIGGRREQRASPISAVFDRSRWPIYNEGTQLL